MALGALTVRDAQFGDVNGNGESMALSLGANGDASTTTTLLTGILNGVEKIAEIVTAMWQGDRADETAESLREADVSQPAEETVDDEGGGFFEGAKRMAGKPSVKFALLLGGLALLMKFADKLVPILAPILKFIKEDVWPIAVKAVTAAFDALTLVFNKVKDAILFLTDPETSLAEKMEGVKTAFKDFGLWLFGLFDNMATKIATAFGMEFAEGETLGSWVGDKLKAGWANIKAWFEGVAPAWLIDGATGVGAWILAKITGVFSVFKTWFGEAKAAWDQDGAAGVWSWAKAKVVAVFQPFIDWFGELKGAWDEGGAVGVFSWIVGEVGRAFKGIITWFSESAVGEWIADKVTGVWGWIKGKLADAWTGISTWFSETGTFLLDGATGIFAWITDKLMAPFDFLIDLFTWPDDPSKSNAEKGITKLIDIVLLPYNLAISFLRSIFGFSDAEAKKDPNYEEFSLGKFIVGKVKDLWEWVKEKFTFDIPKLELPELPDMGAMISAIIGSMLPDPAGKYGWIYNWIPKGDALRALAETARMTPDIDVSMDEAGTDMTGAGSTGAKETINEYKQLKAQEGPPGQSGMNINTIDSSSPTTVNNENIQVIALESEHNDPVQEAFKPKGRMGLYNR